MFNQLELFELAVQEQPDEVETFTLPLPDEYETDNE